MRTIVTSVCLVLSSMPVFAQENAKLALRLEAKEEKIGVRITVFFENLTDKPITLRDGTNPSFSPWPWLVAKVDGKDARLEARAAFAMRFKEADEKTIDPKKRFKLGDILVIAPNARPDVDEPLVPLLHAMPGARTVRLQLQERRRDTGFVAPAEIKVNVGLADTPPRTHTYKTVDELPIKLDVYRLLGDEIRPALVWIHGGALITGHRGALRAEQRQRYLDAGFVVVSIDYRLAPETKLKGIIEDVQDAFKWVRDDGANRYKIDPKRVAVVGHSAGGYLTLMSGFAVEPRPQALVAFYGYGDIAGDWYAKPDEFYRKRMLYTREQAYEGIGKEEIAEGKNAKRSWFYIYCRQNGLWPKEVTGHDPAKEPRAFDRFCPIRNVTKAYPPTMLLHGTNDTDVPHQQSEDMAKELKKRGVTHQFLSMSGMDHGFDGGKGLKFERTAKAFDQVLAFLRKHVPGDAK